MRVAYPRILNGISRGVFGRLCRVYDTPVWEVKVDFRNTNSMILRFFLFDSSLGGVDKSSFSQQTLMELLIEKVTNKKKICGDARNPRDISEWKSIDLNDNLEVTGIEWSGSLLKGALQLQWLPETVESVCARFNNLKGTIDIGSLPASLKKLELSTNRLYGSLDFDLLPPNLEYLELYGNKLSGDVSLVNLPSPLKILHLGGNKFSGTVNFQKLPHGLEKLDLHTNKFTGEVHLMNLPESLSILSLSTNEFSGTLDLTCLPSKLEEIYLSENGFVGTTDFSLLPDSLRIIMLSSLEIHGEIQKKSSQLIFSSSSPNLIVHKESR